MMLAEVSIKVLGKVLAILSKKNIGGSIDNLYFSNEVSVSVILSKRKKKFRNIFLYCIVKSQSNSLD